MAILAVPNWSFGRNRDLIQRFQDILDRSPVTMHYCQGDVDHNRTVTAFSGEAADVRHTLFSLAQVALPSIDLNHHVGVHPRVGALDVCPFVTLNEPLMDALAFAERFGNDLATEFDLPVYLYEKSERGRHEADLPALRKGGFGSLIGKHLNPDFGPSHVHPYLGVTILGVRDFLIALNVNLSIESPALAANLASQIRKLRADGDERFLGVRALGLSLASRGISQVSLNLTLPDITPVDPIIEWVIDAANARDCAVAETELIGVIRDKDLPTAQRLPIAPRQIVSS